MNLEFIPSVCKGEDPEFSGKVVFKVPSYAERMAYQGASGLKFDVDGNVSMENVDPVQLLVKVASDVPKHIVHLDVSKKGGKRYDKYDDMSTDPEFDVVTQELSKVLMSGFKVGES